MDATINRAKAAAGTFKDGFTKVQAKFESTEQDLTSDAEKPAETKAPEPTVDLTPKPEATVPAPVVDTAADAQ